MAPFRSLHSVYATLLCAIVFFLASADRLFTIRTSGVNVRFACIPLLVGFVVWIITRASGSRGDIRSLAIAWLPFLTLYVLAAENSDTVGPATLKAGWFAFNFIIVYGSIALFESRDVVRGYFLSFLAIASIITIDFVTGFTRGPDHMIGYGQLNDMVQGMILFRPHAFYYEPSFAASGLALASVLALTRMRDAAPNIATALAIVGAIALLVMTSRTGWLYATVAGVAVVVFRFFLQRSLRRQSLTRAVVPAVVAVALVFSVLGLSSNREAIGDLFGRLGFSQTVERICPRIAEQFSLNLHCMSDDERRQFFAEGQPINPDDTTEGLRLMTLRNAVANIAQHPWLGVGVGRGSDRFIAAPVVPNLWLEVAHEGGLMALLAFGFGMAYTLSRWGAFERHQRDVMIVLALWFLIAWQFIETFPRLDLWVAFWVVLVWTKRESEVKQDALRDHVFTEGPEGFTPRGIATQ